MWVYPALEGAEVLQDAVGFAVNTGFAVGVTENGSLVGSAFVPEGWEDMLCVSASATLLLGLREDGRVLAYAFRPGDLPDLSAVENAVAIAAGGTHCAVVLRDGSVQVFGDCSRGEDDTADWRLKTAAG